MSTSLLFSMVGTIKVRRYADILVFIAEVCTNLALFVCLIYFLECQLRLKIYNAIIQSVKDI